MPTLPHGTGDAETTNGNGMAEKDAPQPLKEALTAVRGALSKSRDGVLKGARLGRLRLDLLQLKRDKDLMYQRLGREAFYLLQEDRLPHLVELEKPYRKILELEGRIQSLEQQLKDAGQLPEDGTDSSEASEKETGG